MDYSEKDLKKIAKRFVRKYCTPRESYPYAQIDEEALFNRITLSNKSLISLLDFIEL